MRLTTLGFAAAAAGAIALAACSRTENGDVIVKRPHVVTSEDTLHVPTVGTKIDTVNTPVVGTKAETVVVQKPVVGTKKTEVKVPVIRRP